MENEENINNKELISEAEKIKIFENLYRSLRFGMKCGKSIISKEWLKSQKLSIDISGACFNSGQIHHRKGQAFKDSLESIGFLKVSNAFTNNGEIPYTIFGKQAVCFPLKNEEDDIINFYAIGIEKGNTSYLNDQGIYPKYPDINSQRLFIVPNILDASTILEIKILKENESVMALFDGEFKEQHYTAIKAMKELNEIILVGVFENN
jgi:hypothetical protein